VIVLQGRPPLGERGPAPEGRLVVPDASTLVPRMLLGRKVLFVPKISDARPRRKGASGQRPSEPEGRGLNEPGWCGWTCR
jgi:hypothetical protein